MILKKKDKVAFRSRNYKFEGVVEYVGKKREWSRDRLIKVRITKLTEKEYDFQAGENETARIWANNLIPLTTADSIIQKKSKITSKNGKKIWTQIKKL